MSKRTWFCAPVAAISILTSVAALAQMDPLPSWNDGFNKRAIIEFVRTTTTHGSPQFVTAEERIATFDQDGTLWVEQPMYTQVMYCLERVPAEVKKWLAEAKDPCWNDEAKQNGWTVISIESDWKRVFPFERK